MSMVFSVVTVSDGAFEVELVVGGIPHCFDDLVGWEEFDEFAEEVPAEDEIEVHATAYMFGKGEADAADENDVECIKKYIECDDSFLSNCDNIEDVCFSGRFVDE